MPLTNNLPSTLLQGHRQAHRLEPVLWTGHPSLWHSRGCGIDEWKWFLNALCTPITSISYSAWQQDNVYRNPHACACMHIIYIWCCIVLAIHAGKAIGLFSHMFSHITQPTAWKVFLGSCCVKQASDMRSVYTHCYQLSTANQHPETKLSIDTFIEAKTYLELRRFRFGARGAGVSSSSPSSAHSASATASAASGSAFTRLRVVVRAFALGGPGAFTALAIRGRKLIGHP